MSKRQYDTGKTPFAAEQHRRRDRAENLRKASEIYDVPDSARPSRATEGIDAYENPTYYSYTSSEPPEKTQVPETPDITLTDYKPTEPSDMSKGPLFFGKPGQFDEVTTWCEIAFNVSDELAQDKRKQAAYFAQLFRGPTLTWLSKRADKDDLLSNYARLKEACAETWKQKEHLRKAEAARRINYVSQRKSAAGYTREFSDLADILDWGDEIRRITYPRGLKQHVREALITGGPWDTFEDMATEAERIDSELYSLRGNRSSGYRGRGAGGRFTGKCNSCGQFGHKARDCRKGPKRESDW